MLRCFALLLMTLGTVSAAPLAAQTVTGVRNLDFGIVIRGVQTTVSPSDPIRSGRFYVRWRLNRQVQVRFTLPTTLARAGGGGTLPISFSSTDAIAQGTAGSSVPVTFDPNTTQTFTLQSSLDFNVSLGGRVSPSAGQATGTYNGSVTLTVTFF